MKKFYGRFSAVLLVIALPFLVAAQDLHFSQYFNSPLLVNPANTGFAPDVDWRAGVNYRNQWAGLSNNPYKTMRAWADAQAFNNRFENGWVGVGLALLRDQAGSGNLTSTKVYGSLAYHQLLGYSSLLSGGFALGAVNKRIDVTKLTFDNQWNGQFFDITIPSNEPFAYTGVWYLDLRAGLNYAFFPSDKAYLNAGVSVDHINSPKESFYDNELADTKVPMRVNFFANASFKLSDQVIINPNAYVSLMAGSKEILAGANAHYNLSGDGRMQVIGGLYYRVNDAVIPMIGYQLADVTITVNYDATSSTLGSAAQTKGAYEISVVKTGVFSSFGKSVKCPVVSFQ